MELERWIVLLIPKDPPHPSAPKEKAPHVEVERCPPFDPTMKLKYGRAAAASAAELFGI